MRTSSIFYGVYAFHKMKKTKNYINFEHFPFIYANNVITLGKHVQHKGKIIFIM